MELGKISWNPLGLSRPVMGLLYLYHMELGKTQAFVVINLAISGEMSVAFSSTAKVLVNSL